MSSARTIATPDGPFTIIASDAVLAAGWTNDLSALLSKIHPSLRPTHLSGASDVLDTAASLVADYYDGDLHAPARGPVLQRSGPFQEAAWEAIHEILPGESATYAEIAALAGNPQAHRAAACACANNAAALFIPCHRVVRTDRSLGGFAYGLDLKRALLDREDI